MYKKIKPHKTQLLYNNTVVAESLECKVRRILASKESIKDGAPIIYTDRKDGVLPQYDIRTDRMEIAVDAMTKGAKSQIARREESLAQRAKENMEIESKTETTKDASGESTQATPGDSGK